MVLISIIAAMGFADLGIGNGLMNAISEAFGKDDRRLARQHLTSALALMLAIAAALAVVGAIVYPFLPWTRLLNVKSAAAAAEGAKAFLVLYASFILNIPLGVIGRAQSGLQRGYAAQIVNAVGSVLSLGAILIVIAFRANLVWLVSALLFAGIISALLNAWILFHEHPWLLPRWNAYSAASARKIFNLGILFFVLQCAVTLAYTSDNIVIDQVLGVAAVALYAVPQKLFGFVSSVVSMAIDPLWPAYGEAISRGDVGWVKRAFFRSLWLVLAITIPVSAVLVFAGPWILRVAVGKSLQAPLTLLIVLAVWCVVRAVSLVTAILLNGAGVLKAQTVLALVASLCNLGISIYLTHRLGVIGVCLGSILSQLFIVFPAYFFLIPQLFRALTKPTLEEGRMVQAP